jgi:hypothetical protein
MPERTTIVIPPDLKQKAVACARREGISFGALVRQSLEQRLTPRVNTIRGNKATGDSFLDRVQVFESGMTDASSRVDEIVYEALADELRRHGHFSSDPRPKRPVSSQRKGAMAKGSEPRYQQSRNR